MDLNVGATLTGGTTQTWTKQSLAGLKAIFVSPSHTRLAPRTIELGVGGGDATSATPGVARSTFKVIFADRHQEEGCCTTQAGNVIFDGALRWNMNQPEALADDVIAAVRAFVYTTAFANMVKKGLLPN